MIVCLQGGIKLKVYVEDVDVDSDDLVDKIYKNMWISPDPSSSRAAWRQQDIKGSRPSDKST